MLSESSVEARVALCELGAGLERAHALVDDAQQLVLKARTERCHSPAPSRGGDAGRDPEADAQSARLARVLEMLNPVVVSLSAKAVAPRDPSSGCGAADRACGSSMTGAVIARLREQASQEHERAVQLSAQLAEARARLQQHEHAQRREHDAAAEAMRTTAAVAAYECAVLRQRLEAEVERARAAAATAEERERVLLVRIGELESRAAQLASEIAVRERSHRDELQTLMRESDARLVRVTREQTATPQNEMYKRKIELLQRQAAEERDRMQAHIEQLEALVPRTKRMQLLATRL